MEAISKRGGRRIGAGRKKTPTTQFRDAIDAINVPEIVEHLKDWAKGKEVVCPHCGERTGCYTADTVSLQSAIELLNRRLGKVPQQVQVDLTERLQLTGDQVDLLIEKHFDGIVALIEQRYPAIKGLLTQGDIIEGEYKEEGITE